MTLQAMWETGQHGVCYDTQHGRRLWTAPSPPTVGAQLTCRCGQVTWEWRECPECGTREWGRA
jgi:hypothetical protein